MSIFCFVCLFKYGQTWSICYTSSSPFSSFTAFSVNITPWYHCSSFLFSWCLNEFAIISTAVGIIKHSFFLCGALLHLLGYHCRWPMHLRNLKIIIVIGAKNLFCSRSTNNLLVGYIMLSCWLRLLSKKLNIMIKVQLWILKMYLGKYEYSRHRSPLPFFFSYIFFLTLILSLSSFRPHSISNSDLSSGKEKKSMQK